VGLTGNTTGAHLHLEVRPGGGDPVDPYAALAQMGLRP
jgi:murein DD-endopeptidase MepM/ murein hydrolase activator NlpD